MLRAGDCVVNKYGLLSLAACALMPVAPAVAQQPAAASAGGVASHEEVLARNIGTLAYIYGYPAVDYLRLMGETTSQGNEEYAPLNGIYNEGSLIEPGERVYADGRAKTPNNDTIYFRSWIDLRSGPVVISVPDTGDRYYTLTFADFYSEVQHTGRRTTGTDAQQVLVTGPGWRGNVPNDMVPVRVRTNHVLMLGRMLARPGVDEAVANELISQVAIRTLDANAVPAPSIPLPTTQDLTALSFFTHMNRFLRENPRLPGEEALMAQFDTIGVGPSVVFEPNSVSNGTLQGLTSALRDGRNLIVEQRRDPKPGWSSPNPRQGDYGYDYLQRAAVEYRALHANLPREALYLRTYTDAEGRALSSDRRYRMVIARGKEPPADAFWSLSPYNLETNDLIPNESGRYSIGDRTADLKRKTDGSIVVAIQSTKPTEPNVNWLPVKGGAYLLNLRMYQPRTEALLGRWTPPSVVALD